MKKRRHYSEFSCDHFSKNPFLFVALLLSLLLGLLGLAACAGNKMTLQDAKQVTVSMRDESFVPPPRRVDDILASLSQPNQNGNDPFRPA